MHISTHQKNTRPAIEKWSVFLALTSLVGCALGHSSESPFLDEPVQDETVFTGHTSTPETTLPETHTNTETLPTSTSSTPATPEPTHAEPAAQEPTLPNGWIAAPNAFCNNTDNQFIADYVVDGDTLILANGDRVRHIGVDAPELKKNDCWADESRDALMELTPVSAPVCLLSDPNAKNADYWGRLLRYVFVKQGDQWVMQNARLVRTGAAKAYHKYLNGMTYAAEFINAETNAQTEGQGGWKACQTW